MCVIAPLVKRQFGIRVLRYRVTILASFISADLRKGAHPLIIGVIGVAVSLEFDFNTMFSRLILYATSDVVSRCPSRNDGGIRSIRNKQCERAGGIGQSEGLGSL
jgi:hypothetical protein